MKYQDFFRSFRFNDKVERLAGELGVVRWKPRNFPERYDIIQAMADYPRLHGNPQNALFRIIGDVFVEDMFYELSDASGVNMEFLQRDRPFSFGGYTYEFGLSGKNVHVRKGGKSYAEFRRVALIGDPYNEAVVATAKVAGKIEMKNLDRINELRPLVRNRQLGHLVLTTNDTFSREIENPHVFSHLQRFLDHEKNILVVSSANTMYIRSIVDELSDFYKRLGEERRIDNLGQVSKEEEHDLMEISSWTDDADSAYKMLLEKLSEVKDVYKRHAKNTAESIHHSDDRHRYEIILERLHERLYEGTLSDTYFTSHVKYIAKLMRKKDFSPKTIRESLELLLDFPSTETDPVAVVYSDIFPANLPHMYLQSAAQFFLWFFNNRDGSDLDYFKQGMEQFYKTRITDRAGQDMWTRFRRLPGSFEGGKRR